MRPQTGFDAGPSSETPTPTPKYSFNSCPWNAIHSSGCLPQSCVLISSSRMRSCQYDNHREREPFLPSTSRINAAHLHTEASLVRQQLKPQPSGRWEDLCEPQIYKLDFYPFTSCSLPSMRQLRRCWLCGPHACCNYNQIFARVAVHMTEKNWAVIHVNLCHEWLSCLIEIAGAAVFGVLVL